MRLLQVASDNFEIVQRVKQLETYKGYKSAAGYTVTHTIEQLVDAFTRCEASTGETPSAAAFGKASVVGMERAVRARTRRVQAVS
jgi:hypothetical protein